MQNNLKNNQPNQSFWQYLKMYWKIVQWLKEMDGLLANKI